MRDRVIPADAATTAYFRAALDGLRLDGLNWLQISDELGISDRIIRSWREKNVYVDPTVTQISDLDLDRVVFENSIDQPQRGEVMMQACLATLNIHIPRSRLRLSIARVDSAGRATRRQRAIKRRVYSVRGPHSLWHADGNLKLVKFHLVIHAGMDGYSRAITYLPCSDNNRAETVAENFAVAVQRYGWPSRLRTDKGAENRLIAMQMLQHRGVGRGSVIAGRSVHNQRIERFWRDLSKEVTQFYRNLFYAIRNDAGIDLFEDFMAIFVLHYVFLPRINEQLEFFRQVWNNHKLSTEHHKSPNQLLKDSMHLSEAIPALELEHYGLEVDPVTGEPLADAAAVAVEDPLRETILQQVASPVQCPLTPRQYAVFASHVPSLHFHDKNSAVFAEYYLGALQFCREVLRVVV